jgi:hypothetical protein
LTHRESEAAAEALKKKVNLLKLAHPTELVVSQAHTPKLENFYAEIAFLKLLALFCGRELRF